MDFAASDASNSSSRYACILHLGDGDTSSSSNACTSASNDACTSSSSDACTLSLNPETFLKLVTGNSHGEYFNKILEVLEDILKVKNIPITSASKKAKKAKTNTKPKKAKEEKFPDYWQLKEVEDGLKNGKLIKGAIRISSKNSQRAYITNPDYTQRDYVLESFIDRNRALEGDVVAVELKPEPEGKKKKKYRTASVVYILERVHSRITVGFMRAMPDNNKQFLMIIPRDYRIPQIRVLASDCPDFYTDTEKYKNTLFKAKITTWKIDMKYAIGSLVETIGVMGDLQSETIALLAENELDITSFPAEVLENLPVIDTIPETEFQYRKDLRKECIFTIDPLTAHDLDDALSCRKLANGNFEVGVHITDVAYYLKEDTPLDKIACDKGTTIYLVNSVYHMLPQELCSQCSFSPGTDKLAFSVFWEMTHCGHVVHHYFTRTVINSCTQLAYEHAQIMIENPNYNFQDGNLPRIFGDFTYRDLSKIVNDLHKIALNLRGQRFYKGALSMTLPKLIFNFDGSTREPCGFSIYEHKEAHKLVEEFMLLANTYVAEKILEHFPDQAFLRNHQPPNQPLLEQLEKTLQTYGMKVNIQSSKALQLSIWTVQKERKFGAIEMALLCYLIAKPMRRATYFCTANTESKDYYHYALSVPLYTHFTSPIRRYADVVVHRLLASCLGYSKKRQWKVKHLVAVANNCNRQKYNAKCAADASSDLYLLRYITNKSKHLPFVQDAAVVGIGNNYFDIIIPLTGSIIRIYPKHADVNAKCSHKQHVSPKKLVVTLPQTPKFPEQQCEIYLFSLLTVILYQRPKKMRMEAKLWRPVNVRSLLVHTVQSP